MASWRCLLAHLEKTKELEQGATPEELHCRQRRHQRQKSVVPAGSKDGRAEEQRCENGGLLYGVARPGLATLQLYISV